MDTSDKVESVAKKGRPRKEDPITVQGVARQEAAKELKENKKRSRVVETWYELRGQKLSLAKKKANGNVFRVFVGSLDDKKNGPGIRAFVKKLQEEKKLKTRI